MYSLYSTLKNVHFDQFGVDVRNYSRFVNCEVFLCAALSSCMFVWFEPSPPQINSMH